LGAASRQGGGLGKRRERGGEGEGKWRGGKGRAPKLLLNQAPSEPCYATASLRPGFRPGFRPARLAEFGFYAKAKSVHSSSLNDPARTSDPLVGATVSSRLKTMCARRLSMKYGVNSRPNYEWRLARGSVSRSESACQRNSRHVARRVGSVGRRATQAVVPSSAPAPIRSVISARMIAGRVTYPCNSTLPTR